MQVQPKDILDLVAALRAQDDDSQQQPEQFWKPGKKYFIRTVTHHAMAGLDAARSRSRSGSRSGSGSRSK